MSEYNIQMNKYNALNAEYDQLYPATKIENVDGLDTALQNKADLGADGKVPTSQLPAMDYAPSSHTQSASTITAGTFAGRVVANFDSSASVDAGQVRNIYASNTDITAGSTTVTSGFICLIYE